MRITASKSAGMATILLLACAATVAMLHLRTTQLTGVTRRVSVNGMTDFQWVAPCATPCMWSTAQGVVQVLRISGVDSPMVRSMEGPQHYSVLASGQYAYTSTTRLDSDVPIPYFSWAEYSIQAPSVHFDVVIKGASFIASNCHSISGREEYVRRMRVNVRVDAFGQCLGGRGLPHGAGTKQEAMQRYLFHLAFENEISDDYITEKVWGALESGTLPVYLGALNARDRLPPNSTVFASDFESPEELGSHLQLLTEDEERYMQYHEWRHQPLPAPFVRMYEMTHTHSMCRTCIWADGKSLQ